MLQPLKSLLDHFGTRPAILRGVRAAVVLEAARDILESLFPASVCAGLEPKVFQNETVTIAVKNPAFSQEVKMRTAAILRLLNERLGDGTVKRIQLARIVPRQPGDDMLP